LDSLAHVIKLLDMAGAKKGETKPPRKKVLLVDDHPIVRERLGELIALEADLEVCGEAEDANEALQSAEASNPDIAIVDISLKDSYGIELIKDLKERHPNLPVLVVSMHEESMYAERALRAGAKGYLNKQEATKKVIPAIRQILAGQVFVSEAMAANLLQKVATGRAPVTQGGSPIDVMTDRELEIFQLLGEGKSAREIGTTLKISVKTVEAHREHIKQKLNLKTSNELLRYAIESRLRKES
jgi:DNA-binding NarL/FixJ family response regulator